MVFSKKGRGIGLRIPGIILSLTLISGCFRAPEPEPPNIRYGQDVCEECHMIINDEKFSAAYVAQDGSYAKFDDPSCLLLNAENRSGIARSWVHDYESGEWVEAEGAFFVLQEAIRTPMGFDMISFKTREQAERLTRQSGGKLIRWSEVTKLAKEKLKGGLKP